MILRHGYYLAKQNRLCGDLDLARESATQFLSLELALEHCGHYDGVSMFETDDGIKTRILILQDFFSDFYQLKPFRVKVHEF